MSAPEAISAPGARLSIWRDAPRLDDRRTAALGAFWCETARSGAALIEAACARLKDEGYGGVLGPMDGDTWASHRFVVESDSSPPFLMEPQNPDFYPHAFDAAGFKIVSRYVSAVRPAENPPPEKLAAGLVLRPFVMARADEELARIHALCLEAFANNAFYSPISAERFIASYRPVLGFLDPDLVLLGEDDAGALKGFVFGAPDYAQGQNPQSVILKTYASLEKGLGSALANAFHRAAFAKGYRRVIHALMHGSNLSARHSENLGARVFRRYALWGRRL